MTHHPGTMRAADLLGSGGPFVEAWSGYEPRAGQVEMAESVERCLQRGGIALVEAGTGTGKTLGYLVPALLEAHRKRIVISTSTRALQDQIYLRDLPRAMEVLALDVSVALMKGLSNYVCKRRAHAFLGGGAALSAEWSGRLPVLDGWLERTRTGDVSELSELSEDDSLWPRITASSERRIGAGCAFFDECHVTEMKRRAAAADLVVVNHHLFFADLALRGNHPGHVIPDYDAVIFDEAHQLEEVATRYFGVGFSSAQVDRLCRDARPVLARELGASSVGLADRVDRVARELFDRLEASVAGSDGRVGLSREDWAGPLAEAWFDLDAAFESLSGRIAVELARDSEGDGNPAPVLAALSRRADGMREDLADVAGPSAGHVAWFERGAAGRRLGSSPVEIGGLLRERVFDALPSVVLTSATLACGAASGAARAGDEGETVEGAHHEPDASDVSEDSAVRGPSGPFRYLRQRLGLSADYAVDERVVASPFDFERQALLYLPDDLPAPRDPGFAAAAAERAARLIDLCDGGAFVLTTSHRAMLRLHAALRSRFPDRLVLVQGQLPKTTLIDSFQSADGAVLVATLGFWQGVDVPGSALRLVILEKAPFPVPTEPLLEARARALSEMGEAPFTRLHLPLAQLTLKQGFGRLIRHRGDRGVVALLDARVHRRGYGKRLLDGLPPARRVVDLASVEAFWRSCDAAPSTPGAEPEGEMDFSTRDGLENL